MYTVIKLTKQAYRGFFSTITSNPTYDKVRNEIHLSDYSAGFSNHNYGCYIEFDTYDDIDELLFLIT